MKINIDKPLSEVRKSCNKTQKQVAKELNISRQRVSTIERRIVGTLYLSTLKRYCAALGLNINIKFIDATGVEKEINYEV